MNPRVKRKINVRSLDFDGSQFHPGYIESKSKNRLIESNDDFITQLAQETNQCEYDESIFMVGSNRQSKRIDEINSPGVGSCFPALHALCAETKKRAGNKTKFRVDGYLLADTYSNRPAGENFENAVKNNKNYRFSDWHFDESKLTLLYAQMHKIASENPHDDITFDFYDDRNDDILMNLFLFFNNNRDLMPKNLKLKLHCYAGEGISNFKPIQGEGEPDYNYEKNVKLMANIANSKNVLPSLYQNNKLKQFKAQRKTAKVVVVTPTLTPKPIPAPQSTFSFSDLFCCGPRRKQETVEEQRRLLLR